jgi:hypothetical protein
MIPPARESPRERDVDSAQELDQAWHVRLGGICHGPMSRARMQQQYDAGIYTRWHECSHDGAHWQPLTALVGHDVRNPDRVHEQGPLEPDLHPKDWQRLTSSASSEPVAVREFTAPMWDLSRMSQASYGLLLTSLGLLPVVADQGHAVGWWAWPEQAPGWLFGIAMALWMLLGVSALMLSLLPEPASLPRSRQMIVLGVGVVLACGLAACSGFGTGLVALAWLVLMIGLVTSLWLDYPERALISSALGLAALASVYATLSSSLTGISLAAWGGCAAGLFGLGLLFNRFGTPTGPSLAATGLVLIMMPWLATGLTACDASFALSDDQPQQAGAQFVRCFITASAMTGLTGWLCGHPEIIIGFRCQSHRPVTLHPAGLPSEQNLENVL